MSKNKTHYRKVFKSDHLGVADLEDLTEAGSNMVFTIKHVRQEIGAKVAGKKLDCNVAYFNEPIKPMVLNAGNSKILKGFAGGSPFVEDWVNIPVALYIDPRASIGGNVVGGVRINPTQPQTKKTLTPDDTKNWENAKNAYKRDGNFDKILARMDMSDEHKEQMKTECASV